jgi:hypothetical protein
VDLAAVRRGQAEAREAQLAPAILLIGRGRDVWVNYWRHYTDDKPGGLASVVFDCEDAARSAAADCNPPVWESKSKRHAMLYMGTVIHRTNGETVHRNLAQPVRPSDGDAA